MGERRGVLEMRRLQRKPVGKHVTKTAVLLAAKGSNANRYTCIGKPTFLPREKRKWVFARVPSVFVQSEVLMQLET